MSHLKTIAPRRKRRTKKTNDLRLQDVLERVNDSVIADALSVFFAELSRALVAGDEEMTREANRSIAEALRGMPEKNFDEPLISALRRRDRKARRARQREAGKPLTPSPSPPA